MVSRVLAGRRRGRIGLLRQVFGMGEEGCQFDRDYVCRIEGAAVARLTNNGRFERVSPR